MATVRSENANAILFISDVSLCDSIERRKAHANYTKMNLPLI